MRVVKMAGHLAVLTFTGCTGADREERGAQALLRADFQNAATLATSALDKNSTLGIARLTLDVSHYFLGNTDAFNVQRSRWATSDTTRQRVVDWIATLNDPSDGQTWVPVFLRAVAAEAAGDLSAARLGYRAAADASAFQERIARHVVALTEQWALSAPPTTSANAVGHAVAIHGNWAAVGAVHIRPNGFVRQLAHVYQFDGFAWNFHQELPLEGQTEWPLAPGRSKIRMDRDLIVVRTSHSLHIHRLDGSTWREDRVIHSRDLGVQQFGSHAVSDDRIIVNAMFRDGRESVFLFQRDQGKWIRETPPRLRDASGGQFALQGNVLVTAGKLGAFVYRHDGRTWIEEARLTATSARREFHPAGVALVNGTILVGNAVSRPEAFLFERGADGRWAEKEWFRDTTLYNGADTEALGRGVAVLSASAVHVNGVAWSGAVWVYRQEGSRWGLARRLTEEPPRRNGYFGFDVDVDGELLIVSGWGPAAFAGLGQGVLQPAGALSGSARIYNLTRIAP